MAVGRRSGHGPLADVSIRYAGIEQNLLRREIATERGRELRHPRVLHDTRPTGGLGTLQPDARTRQGVDAADDGALLAAHLDRWQVLAGRAERQPSAVHEHSVAVV